MISIGGSCDIDNSGSVLLATETKNIIIIFLESAITRWFLKPKIVRKIFSCMGRLVYAIY